MARESSTWIIKRASPAENASPRWVTRECSAVSSVSSWAMTSPRRCARAHQPHMPRPSRAANRELRPFSHSIIHSFPRPPPELARHTRDGATSNRPGASHLGAPAVVQPLSAFGACPARPRDSTRCLRRLTTRQRAPLSPARHTFALPHWTRSRCSLHISNHSY
jgi:hypothetical protein